jgi:hypothetical protein
VTSTSRVGGKREKDKNMCDCKQGQFLCPEAEQIWANYTSCHHAFKFDESAKWREAYQRHIEASQHSVHADGATLFGCRVVVDPKLPAGKVVLRKPRRR